MSPSAPATRLSASDERRLITAIGAAELGHRGEIRVHVEPRYRGDGPLGRARELFRQLRMDRTRDGTGVLLYVALDDRKAAVYADDGIHGAAEPSFWQTVIDGVSAGFKAGDPIPALITAVDQVGELLRAHAPAADTAGNELPNAVSRG